MPVIELLISWGPLGLFVLAVLDSAGVPLVGGVDLLLLGMAAVRPGAAYVAATFATAGSLLGCLILFYIARKGGQRYLDRHTAGGRGQKLRLWFQKYGLATVFVPALSPIPLPTKVFVLCAGALRVRLASFLLVVLAARIPRYFGLAYLGSRLGEGSEAWLKSHGWYIAAAALGLFVLAAVLVKLGGILLRRAKSGLPMAVGLAASSAAAVAQPNGGERLYTGCRP